VTQTREMDGVFAGTTADVEQVFTTRETALETLPRQRAQGAAQRRVGELRVVVAREPVEGNAA